MHSATFLRKFFVRYTSKVVRCARCDAVSATSRLSRRQCVDDNEQSTSGRWVRMLQQLGRASRTEPKTARQRRLARFSRHSVAFFMNGVSRLPFVNHARLTAATSCCWQVHMFLHLPTSSGFAWSLFTPSTLQTVLTTSANKKMVKTQLQLIYFREHVLQTLIRY